MTARPTFIAYCITAAVALLATHSTLTKAEEPDALWKHLNSVLVKLDQDIKKLSNENVRDDEAVQQTLSPYFHESIRNRVFRSIKKQGGACFTFSPIGCKGRNPSEDLVTLSETKACLIRKLYQAGTTNAYLVGFELIDGIWLIRNSTISPSLEYGGLDIDIFDDCQNLLQNKG